MEVRIFHRIKKARLSRKYVWLESKDDFSSSSFLPIEIVVEILVRVSFRCLLIFQLVCKEWKEIIHGRYFLKRYMKCSRVIWHQYNVPVRVVWNQYNMYRRVAVNYHGISASHELYTYGCGCDGLVLLKKSFSHKVCVWNPATRLVLELPDLHSECRKICMAYVPASNNYKIVSIYDSFDASGRVSCELFTPGESKSWRQLAFPDILKEVDPSVGKLVKVWTIPAGVAVYCLYILLQADMDIHAVIISLDIATEYFTVTHLSQELVTNWRGSWCTDWDGKLVFAKLTGKNLKVLDFEYWKKHNRCDENKSFPLRFLKNCKYHMDQLAPLFAEQDEIWFWLRGKRVFSYSIVTGECTGIEGTRDYAPACKIYPYRPSMVKFDAMEPDSEYEWLRQSLTL